MKKKLLDLDEADENKTNVKRKDLKVNKESFSKIIDKMGFDEYLTKSNAVQKKYNKFVNSVVPEKDFNYMADLLMLPTTDEGYKYLLVVTDLATSLFDCEPMKNKEGKSTVEAYKQIVKRKILTFPEISLKTDGGTEFKKDFKTFMEAHDVWVKTSQAYRHKQMSPVESLNNTISRLLNNYMNQKSLELEEHYNNWTDVLPMIRKELNKYRKRDLRKLKEYQQQHQFNPIEAGEPKYKIGDLVHYKLERPHDILGKAIEGNNKFRQGDLKYSIEVKKIVDVLYYHDAPWFRYKLENMPHVSLSEHELKLAKDNKHQNETNYIVKKIIDKRTQNKQTQYLVWWSKYLKKEATWESEKSLLEDGLKSHIDEYNKSIKKKK